MVSIPAMDAKSEFSLHEFEDTLIRAVREDAIATRRHIDVVAQGLRDDLRTIAEGLATIDAKLETMRGSR